MGRARGGGRNRSKVLVVGANSMLATAFVAYAEQRYRIVTADRSLPAHIRLDLSKPAIVDVGCGIDAVVHCASAFGDDTGSGMIENELVNSVGAIMIADAAVRAGCRHFVNIGTLSSFDRPQNEYFNAYGLSKRHAEENIKYICQRGGVRWTSLRVSQLYDARGRGRAHQPLLYRILERAAAGQDIVLHGAVDPLRNFLYVDDLAQAIERVLDRGLVGEHPCVASRSYRLSAVAALALRVYGRGGRVRFDRTRPNLRSIWIPSSGRLYSALDWRPPTGLRQGLELVMRMGGA